MVVDSLLIVTPIVGFCNCSMFCCALLCIHSSFAIISMGKTELVTLLCSSSWCLVFSMATHIALLKNGDAPTKVFITKQQLIRNF